MNLQPLPRCAWSIALMTLLMGGVGAGCGNEAPSDVASVEKKSVCDPYCALNTPDLQNAAVDGMLIRSIFRNSGDESWNLTRGRNGVVDPIALPNISMNGNKVVKLRGERGFFNVTFLEPPFFTPKTKGGTNTAGLKLKFSMVNGAGQRKNYQLKLFSVIPATSSDNYAKYDIRWALDNGQSDANNTWTNICGQTPEGQQLSAFVVSGFLWGINHGSVTYDDNAITIACQDDAVGACIDSGYEPWVDRIGNPYLWDSIRGLNVPYAGNDHLQGRDIHQTCTRARRVDFAGRGFSYTDSGTSFVVADSLDSTVSPLALIPTSHIEAIWGPFGALCRTRDNLRKRNDFSSPEAYDAYMGVPLCLTQDVLRDGIQVTAY